jgi:hypothetical protein
MFFSSSHRLGVATVAQCGANDDGVFIGRHDRSAKARLLAAAPRIRQRASGKNTRRRKPEGLTCR